LRNQGVVIELTQDRKKAWAFKIGLTRLEREAATLKQELTDHQQSQHLDRIANRNLTMTRNPTRQFRLTVERVFQLGTSQLEGIKWQAKRVN
jgi:hypothetical protein